MAYMMPLSAKSRSIAEEKSKGWEYALTASLFDDWIKPIDHQWKDLQDGFYKPARHNVADTEVIGWFAALNETITDQIAVLNVLVEVELTKSWGPPGHPGSVEEIERACFYLSQACKRLLEIEENIQSARVSETFVGLVELYSGAIGPNISSVRNMERILNDMLKPDAKGEFSYTVKIALPASFEEKRMRVFDELNKKLDLGDDF